MKNLLLLLIFAPLLSLGQGYWQQRVEYQMDIDFNVNDHTFKGLQILKYYNNSPDTLEKVFYHLYFNAFQPNSMMDVRSRVLPDPDRRVRDRILHLKENEVGFHEIEELKQDGESVSYEIENTVAEVKLVKPILPGASTVFTMKFNSQVPLQVRRSGRDNAEGISYSMAQWYPKLAEYDKSGWHAHPYIAREFYGSWGDFNVNITIDKDFVLAAGAVLQNPEEIGYGYIEEDKVQQRRGKKLTWKFKAENVHDFMWAADPDYVHEKLQVPDGPLLHFFYQGDTLAENWKKLPKLTSEAFQYMSKTFGKYPYSDFYVIQGGDGGMEYPMSTLINGHRSMTSLLSVTVHEAFHSWYQGVLATNESYYAWMDEGFTEFAENLTKNYLYGGLDPSPHAGNYAGYFALAKSGFEEPMTTHSDHFETNFAYGRAAYSKGAVTLSQLGYIIGNDVLMNGLRRYFDTWKFKHPDRNDFIRIMEKESEMELDWYFDWWINTTKTIDYGIDSVFAAGDGTKIVLKRSGKIPMPIDLVITRKDETRELFYIPLGVMRGEKKNESSMNRTVLKDWYWTSPFYDFTVPIPFEDIRHMEIDASRRMADVNRKNNTFSGK